ncbi:MAG TPA: radical SAM protein [bacterium]|nr:radical SAM protein [bacterium]HPN32022.1 radical SAM protein [bacterium]
MKLLNYSRLIKDIAVARLNRRLGKPSNLKMLYYAVTWRCNSNCIFCDVKKLNRKNSEELTAKNIGKIFEDKYLKKLEYLKITGGEPTIKEDIIDIVSEIYDKSKPAYIGLTTNGLNTETSRNLISKISGFDSSISLRISVDGTGDNYNKIRNCGTGAFNRVVKTLEMLKQFQNKKNISIGINQTVSKETLGNIEEVKKLCSDLKYDYYLFFALPTRNLWKPDSNAALSNSLEDYLPVGKFTDEEIKMILDSNINDSAINLLKSKNNENLLSLKYYQEGFYNRIKYGKLKPNPICLALFNRCILDPYGNIMACNYITHPAGNVLKNDFAEIWNSDASKKTRSLVKTCNKCWLGCEVIPNAIYSGDILKWMIRQIVTGN